VNIVGRSRTGGQRRTFGVSLIGILNIVSDIIDIPYGQRIHTVRL
jgi:hypothetical protein